MSAEYWDYTEEHGEQKWPEKWSTSARQSPIDIQSRDVFSNNTLKPLKFEWNGSGFELHNKGLNVRLGAKSDDRSYLSGGPLSNKYRLAEAHMHWSASFEGGSEHSVDGHKYSAELHLVHWDDTRFSSMADALADPSGLSVVGVFIEVVDQVADANVGQKALKSLLGMTKQVPYKNDMSEGHGVNPYDVLDDVSGDFFTYEGSLTTPPLSECVRWIVMRKPVQISREDFAVLHGIHCVEQTPQQEFYDPFSRQPTTCCDKAPFIRDNYRNVLPVAGRLVEASF